MPLPKVNPSQTKAWEALKDHFKIIKDLKMTSLFREDIHRAKNYTITWEDFLVDYSKNRVTDRTLELLQELAQQVNLKEAIEAQFNGEVINETERSEVLHTALRAPKTTKVFCRW